jgi:hypothetical protein
MLPLHTLETQIPCRFPQRIYCSLHSATSASKISIMLLSTTACLGTESIPLTQMQAIAEEFSRAMEVEERLGRSLQADAQWSCIETKFLLARTLEAATSLLTKYEGEIARMEQAYGTTDLTQRRVIFMPHPNGHRSADSYWKQLEQEKGEVEKTKQSLGSLVERASEVCRQYEQKFSTYPGWTKEQELELDAAIEDAWRKATSREG